MIGNLIKKERECLNMTAKDLAKASGVALHKLYEQEREERTLTVDELFRVDSVLDNNIVWELINVYGSMK